MTQDIIPLDKFCTHKKMWEKCELLKSIVLAEKTVKERVGRKYVEKKELKFKTDKAVIDRIVRSAEHYKNLYLNEQIEKDRIEENLVFTLPGVQFRDYQTKIIYDGAKILSEHGFLYLAMEVRTGKTLTSLGIASKTCIGNVLFLTKKKAMSSIDADYKMLAPMYDLTIMNYESLHKLPDDIKWELIICDEAVAALDVSVQAQVLNLLNDLKEEFGLTYLFISHDMPVVYHMSNNVMVMRKGELVEKGSTEEVFLHPSNDYTQRLMTIANLK